MPVTNQLECVCGVKYWPNQAWQHKGCVAVPVANTVTNQSVSNQSVSNSVSNSLDGLRVTNWRKANPDRYREYMREYMRKRRARVT